MKIRNVIIFIIFIMISLLLKQQNITSLKNNSYYSPLLLSSDKTYSWEGGACGKSEYQFSLSKTIGEDENYLCKIKNGKNALVGSKNVTIRINEPKYECTVTQSRRQINKVYEKVETFIINDETSSGDNVYEYTINEEYGYLYKYDFDCSHSEDDGVTYNGYKHVYEDQLLISDIGNNEQKIININFRQMTLDSSKTSNSSGNITITEAIKRDNPTKNITPNYSNISSDSDSGLYEANSSNGTTYYFRGNVNNYVQFAKFMWRIIRINEDGSIRMILDGDIGSSRWGLFDDSNYKGLTYDVDLYQPLVGKKSDNVEQIPEGKICYSDKFVFDNNTKSYALLGDVKCYDGVKDEALNKYSLYSTNKSDSSNKLYKITKVNNDPWATAGNCSECELDPNFKEHYLNDLYDASYVSGYESSLPSSTRYCISRSYEISNGYYKLSGRISCNSGDMWDGYYSLLSNNSDATSSEMYYQNGSHILKFNELVKLNQLTYSNDIKIKLDDWYGKNLNYYPYYNVIKYTSFCKDSKTTTLSFNCNEYDRLSVGLITATEMSAAGAVYGKVNENYYLAYDKPFWTMTSTGNNSIMAVSSVNCESLITLNYFTYASLTSEKGRCSEYKDDLRYSIRPVISIDGDYKVYPSTDGTRVNPYKGSL